MRLFKYKERLKCFRAFKTIMSLIRDEKYKGLKGSYGEFEFTVGCGSDYPGCYIELRHRNLGIPNVYWFSEELSNPNIFSVEDLTKKVGKFTVSRRQHIRDKEGLTKAINDKLQELIRSQPSQT